MNTTRRSARGGFSLVELMIVSLMVVILTAMISDTWSSVGRSVRDAVQRARVLEESQIVTEALRRDLSGYYPNAKLSKDDENQLLGRAATADGRLLLCFDADGDEVAEWGKPDVVIVYELQGSSLVRINETDKGRSYVVSPRVTKFAPLQLADGLKIQYTVEDGDFANSFTLVSRDP